MKLSCSFGLAALFATSVVGCTSAPTQTIQGRIEQSTFAAPVQGVRAYIGTARVAEAAVAADGSFTLDMPPGHGARIELVSATPSRVIFPRQGGTIDVSFTVLAGGAVFDLGTVRHIGSSTGHSFSFHTADSESSDCHDGQDASGATCVDDEDENGGACQADGSGSGSGDGSSAGSGDGSSTDGSGGSGDGSAADGSGSGGNDGGDDADHAADESQPADTAVADHNFPADGCNAEDGSGGGSGGSGGGSGGGSDGSGSDS